MNMASSEPMMWSVATISLFTLMITDFMFFKTPSSGDCGTTCARAPKRRSGARSRRAAKNYLLIVRSSAATELYRAGGAPPLRSRSRRCRGTTRPARADDVARARMRWRILATISAASAPRRPSTGTLCESSSASRKMQRNCRGMGVRGAWSARQRGQRRRVGSPTPPLASRPSSRGQCRGSGGKDASCRPSSSGAPPGGGPSRAATTRPLSSRPPPPPPASARRRRGSSHAQCCRTARRRCRAHDSA